MKNKHYKIVLIALMMSGAQSFFAQTGEFQVGGRYAMGVSNIDSDGLEDPSGRLSFNGGFTGLYHVSEQFKLGVDILGSWKGANDEGREYIGEDVFGEPAYRDYKAKYKFIDLEVPIMASLHLLEGNFNISLSAGVATNFNLISLDSRAYENDNYNEDNGYENSKMNGIDPAHFSHILSCGFHVGEPGSQRFFFEVRNVGPLSSLGKVNNDAANHRRLELGIGYYL